MCKVRSFLALAHIFGQENILFTAHKKFIFIQNKKSFIGINSIFNKDSNGLNRIKFRPQTKKFFFFGPSVTKKVYLREKTKPRFFLLYGLWQGFLNYQEWDI